MPIRPLDIRRYEQDIRRIAEFHRDEVERKHASNASVDIDAYLTLQSTGDLIALGVFNEDDQLVGYACAFVAQSFHYGHRVSTNDSIFVMPEYRKLGYGLRLMREVERISKDKGAKFMLWQAKIDSPLSRILPRCGCSPEEIVFIKEM